MQLEVLTVPDCPHRDRMLHRVREALQQLDLGAAAVSERIIESADVAAAAGMHGSPTLLIDGRDPFADDTSAPGSLSCRLYRELETGVDGAPSVTALVEALTGDHHR